MCMPSINPLQRAPSKPPQASKAPDLNIYQNRRSIMQAAAATSGSSLLTGRAGVPGNSLTLGGVTLLGGNK